MRTKRMKQEHQGRLNMADRALLSGMQNRPKEYFTTLDICRIAKCASARDRIRKLQASGVKIGPAKLLRVNPNGSRVFGWRIG